MWFMNKKIHYNYILESSQRFDARNSPKALHPTMIPTDNERGNSYSTSNCYMLS
jgi:hypothetical protein